MKVFIVLLFIPITLLSQHSFIDYNDELKKLNFMKEFFEKHKIYCDSNYVEFLKSKIQDSIKIERDTLFGSIYSGYARFSRKDNVIINYVGLWTWKTKKGNLTEYSFYDLEGYAKGPNWRYRRNGKIKEKRFWNQTDASETTSDGSYIIMKEYYSIKYRKNGSINKEGKYLLGKRNGLWNFYNRKGKLKKAKTY